MKVKEYEVMGTHFKLSIISEISETDFTQIVNEVNAKMQDFDNKFSRFKSDSLVTKMSKEKGIYKVGNDFINILKMYFEFYDLTNGKINPLIGNTLSDLGYDIDYNLKKKDIVRLTPKLIESIKIIDEESLEIIFPCIIDIGAIGKGFFVDIIVDYLNTKNIDSFVFDGSGDLYIQNIKDGYDIGLENPFNNGEVLGVLNLNNQALCSSGTNKRVWGENNHYVDPDKLASPKFIVATFVVTDSVALSDALTSALFFTSPDILKEKYKFEYLVVSHDSKLSFSELFKNSIFV